MATTRASRKAFGGGRWPRVGFALAAALGAWALTTTSARAVPTTTVYAGQLAQSGTPFSGSASLTFVIYDADGAGGEGTVLWEETHASVTVTMGAFSVLLGERTPLDTSLFDGSMRWLEVSVNGETLSPRVPLASVPYAIRAGDAENLGGSAPAEYARHEELAMSGGASVHFDNLTGFPECTVSGTTTGECHVTIPCSCGESDQGIAAVRAMVDCGGGLTFQVMTGLTACTGRSCPEC